MEIKGEENNHNALCMCMKLAKNYKKLKHSEKQKGNCEWIETLETLDIMISEGKMFSFPSFVHQWILAKAHILIQIWDKYEDLCNFVYLIISNSFGGCLILSLQFKREITHSNSKWTWAYQSPKPKRCKKKKVVHF